MSKHFFQSASIRSALINAYRIYARLHIGRTGPKVFINSIPKAGTHLVTTTLSEIPALMNSRLHIETWPVSTYGPELRRRPASLLDFKVNDKLFIQKLNAIKPGQFCSAHLPWDSRALEILQEHGFKVIFVNRNPESILNSLYHYVTGLKRHYLHKQLLECYDSNQSRMIALRQGMPFINEQYPGLDSLDDHVQAYSGWSECDGRESIITVNFEDLIGSKGGGSDETRIQTIDRMLNFLAIDHINALDLHNATNNKKSVTFRKGTI